MNSLLDSKPRENQYKSIEKKTLNCYYYFQIEIKFNVLLNKLSTEKSLISFKLIINLMFIK